MEQKRRIRKETRQLFTELNRAFRDWEKLGVISDEASKYIDMLESFYDNNDIKVANPQKFTIQKFLTPEQENELLDIALAMSRESRAFVETFEEISKNENSVYYGADVKDIVLSINTIDRSMNDALLREIFDSDEIRELQAESHKAGLQWDEVVAWIVFEYQSSGATHEAMTNRILNAIWNYEEDETNWK